MTYVSWRRDLILSTIDQFSSFMSREGSDTLPPADPGVFDELLKQLNRSLPTQDIAITMSDLVTAQTHLCTPQQREIMQAFNQHLATQMA